MNRGDIVKYVHDRTRTFYGIVNGPHARHPQYTKVTLYTPKGPCMWNASYPCLTEKLEVLEEA